MRVSEYMDLSPDIWQSWKSVKHFWRRKVLKILKLKKKFYYTLNLSRYSEIETVHSPCSGTANRRQFIKALLLCREADRSNDSHVSVLPAKCKRASSVKVHMQESERSAKCALWTNNGTHGAETSWRVCMHPHRKNRKSTIRSKEEQMAENSCSMILIISVLKSARK